MFVDRRYGGWWGPWWFSEMQGVYDGRWFTLWSGEWWTLFRNEWWTIEQYYHTVVRGEREPMEQ